MSSDTTLFWQYGWQGWGEHARVGHRLPDARGRTHYRLRLGEGRGNGDPQRRPTIRPRRPGDFFGSAPCDAAMKIIAAASASAAMLIV